MILFWRLAFRNLMRHRGRFILNLILLVSVFSVIVCFKGFKTNILETIQTLIVDTQFGHIQIAKQSFWENSPVEQVTDKMIDNYGPLIEKISKIHGVQFVSPRVSFYGLLNTEQRSVSAHFIAVQPEVETRMQQSLLFTEGKQFKQSKEAILSIGLKSKLQVKPNDDITLVSPNLSGGINAIDLKVSGIFSSGFSEIDTGTVYVTIQAAEKILDSGAVDKLLIRLDDEKQSPQIVLKIRELLQGTDLKIKTWRELADLYSQVENFYIFQNLFIEIIILLLVFLSVTNTVSMTVFERLSEIGTLRALGDYESHVQQLFLAESVLLGLISISFGIPVSMLLVKFDSSLEIPLVLPLASQPIQIRLLTNFEAYLEASLVCLVSVVVASLWPARKASQISIVTALGARV